jgi:hypothetical protein
MCSLKCLKIQDVLLLLLLLQAVLAQTPVLFLECWPRLAGIHVHRQQAS